MAIFVLFLSYVSVIFEEWERERGTYEEKPFGEEAFGLGEVGCQEGGHGEFVFWGWFCGKWYFILSSGLGRWCWVV